MKKIFTQTIGALAVAALSTVSTFAQTTGFNQTGAGPWDYNTTGNWVGGTINGLWDTSLSLSAGQTVTFAAPTTLSTGLTFNYGGNFALTLQASAAGTQNLTLGGDVGLNTGGGTTANVTIGNSANHLSVDLGGANRTFTVAASRTLTLVDVLSGSGFGITNAGLGTLVLNGANTYDGGATINAGTLVFGNGSALGTGVVTANGGALKWSYVSGNTILTNNIVVNGTTTFDVGSGNFTFNGNLSGSGAITRGTAATLSLYLGGDNSAYSGTFTSPNNGNAVVRFTSTNAGSANASWVFNQPTAGRTDFEFNGAGTISFGSLTGTGPLQSGNAAGTKTISAGALGLTDTYSGVIANGSSPVALTKVGSGTMTLSGANTYTGDTTISAGTLTIGGAGKLGGGSYAGAIINNGSFNYGSSAAQSLSGPISGSGNLTVSAGILTLASPQSFSQNTIAVNDGAALNESFIPSVQMTATSLNMGSASGATMGFVPNSTSVARVTAGTMTLNGANTINIIGGNLAAGSSYPLIAYTTLAGSGTYTLGTLPAGVAGNLSVSANTIYFNVTGVTNTLWTGTVNGTWDINTTVNWTNSGTLGNTYINGSPVQFDDTGLNTTTISNAASTTLSPLSVLVTNNSKNYAFKANTIIAGAASLTKTGTANLTNSTANTYTGPTAINQGQLVVGVASVANTSGALGNNSAVSLANDSTAVLNLNNFATQIGSLSGGGLAGGNVTLGSATLTLGADNTSSTYAGIVSGTGGLTKIGAGTLTLSGAHTFTGGWAVNAGTLNYNGSLASGGQLTVNGSGVNSVVNIGSGANINFNNANLLVGNNATAAGAVFQTGTVTGANQLQLGAITGGSYGYYNLSGSAALTIKELDCAGFNGAPTGVFDITGGTLTDTAWLIIARASGGPSLLNLTGGTLNFTGTAANQFIMNFNANATQSAVINVANAGFYATNATSGILNMMRSGAAGEFAAVNLLSGGIMQVQGVNAGNTTGTSHFNFNGGTLKAATANATFLTANVSLVNVYAGGGTVDNNGVNITIPKALTAPSGYGLNGPVTVNSGGSGYIGAPAVTFSGDGTGATAYATVSGGAVTGVVITSPGVNYSSTPTIIFTGGGGTGASATAPTPTANTSGGMTFQGSGTTTLTGYPSYTGGTKVLGGTLVLNSATGLPSGGNLVVSNATLNLDASSGTLSANDVSVGSTLNLTVSSYANAINGTGNLTVSDNTTNNLVYGTVSSAPSAAVIKAAGTLAKGTNIVFNVSATGLQPGWIVPLIEADSTAMTTNGFVLGALPTGIKAVLTNSTPNTLDLLVTSAGQLLTWHGSEDGSTPAINWDIATSTNWSSLPSYAAAKYQQYLGNTIGDNVIFGDYVLYTDGTNHVNVTTNVVPATVIFSSSYPYEFHGAGGIGGGTSVALTNTYAAVYLNTSNFYTGGTFVSSGTLVITNDYALGAVSGGLTLGGGALQLDAPVATSRGVTVTTNSTIAVAANATAQLSGSCSGAGLALTVSGSAYSGATAGSAGTFNLTGPGTNTVVTVGTYPGNTWLNLSTDRSANNLLVGNSGSAAVSQTGGNIIINGGGGDAVSVGNIFGAFGYYNIQGGTLTANGLAVGGENNNGSGFSGTGGDGLMEINGGTVNDIGWLVMARGTSAEMGVLNIFSGSLTYAGGGLQCNYGTGQTSIINILGGSVSSTNMPVNFRNAGNTGILNLNGGSLQPSAVTGSGILNFNGGTLKSIANNGNFLSVAGANVYSGGATIDDSGYSVTINPPLLAPAGYGVSSISLSDGGSGYIAPPIVTISGGTGSNATAIATISGGSVTGIAVTSAGTGYGSSDILFLTFTGGGASVTQPTVSAVNLALNTSGGLTKLGSGTLTLNGADTYAGNTVINAGKLLVTSAHQATNSVTVADGATYGVQLTGGPATVTNASLTFASGSTTLSFSLGNNSNPGQPLLACGPLTNNSTLSVIVGGNSSLFAVGSAIPLVKYSGAIAGAGSLNPTIAAPRGASLTLSNDVTGHMLYAVVNAAGSGIVWTGTNSMPGLANLWDLNSTTNWLFGGSPTTYQETIPPGDAVTFNDLGSGTVLLSNTVSPASVTISNSAVNYTFQGTGSISGTAALTKQGSNTVTMNLANTYTGGTVISNGTLAIGNGSALGTGTIAMDGGTLTWKYVSGNAVLTNSVVVNGSNTFDVVNGNCTINGNISGAGTLTRSIGVTPPISLYLGGDNSGFTGIFQDQNSANSVTRFSANTAGSASARWIFNQPTLGRTSLPSVSGTIQFGSLSGNGTLSDGGSGIANTVEVGALGLNDTFSGVIGQFTGTVGLTKVGTGTLTLSGANSYTGPTLVNNGTLNVSSAKVSTGDFTVADGATLGVNLATSGTSLKMTSLTLGNNSTNSFTGISSTTVPAITNSGALTLNGTVVVNARGFMSIGQYPLIYSDGGITGFGGFTVGTLPYGAAANIITNGGNTIVLNVTTAPAATVWTGVMDGNWNTTTTNWTAAATPVLYADGSSVQFDDTSVRTNVMIVTNVSPVTVLVSNNVNQYTFSGGAIAGSATLTKNGTGALILANTNTYSGGTTINGGTMQLGDGTANNGAVAGNVTNNATLTFANPIAQSYSGVISGTGALAKTGSGTLTLSAQNTFTGGTVVNNGILALATGGGSGTVRGTLTVNSGATVSLTTADALGYNNDATRVSVVNINGGTVDDAISGNEGYRTSFNLTGGNLTSSGGGSFNFTTGQAISNLASSVSSTVSAPIVLRDGVNLAIDVAAGTVPSGIDLGISGAVVNGGGGGGGIVKSSAGKLVLTGTNTYTGATTVNNGTLLVNGSIASAVSVNGGALGGTGTVSNSVTVNSGGTLSPGSSGSGTLMVNNNLTMNAGSTNTFAVNGSTLAKTAVAVGGTASYGGVLNIVPAGSFSIGQTFTLFSGTGATNASNFASIAGSPGSGLAFSFTNGVLSVVAGGPSGPANLTNSYSGGVLSLSWPAGQGWRLQMQTNSLSTGLNTNWTYITDGSVSSTNITVDPTKPTVFYRLQYP